MSFSSRRRVVVTGIGVLSPLGSNLAGFFDALLAGRGAVRPLPAFNASALPVQIGAEIDGFDARDYLANKDRKSLKTMARTVQLAVAGARLALDDAGVRPRDLEPAR